MKVWKVTERKNKYLKIGRNKGFIENTNELSSLKPDKNKLSQILREKKIKSIPLKVSAPFHCSLMKPAAINMSKKINETTFKKPNFEIVNNVNANSKQKPEEIKKLLIDQISSTVRWRESLLYMVENGVNEFIEIGPGKVLSGLAKRIGGNINVKSINTIEDIKSLK